MDLTFGEGTSDVIGLFCGKGEGGTINNCYVVQVMVKIIILLTLQQERLTKQEIRPLQKMI